VQGEFKNTIKIKVHVENFSPKNRQKFRCQFFRDLFCFIAVSGVSQRWEFKNATKMFCKKIVSKSFYKKFDHKSQTDFPLVLGFLITFWGVLGRFSASGEGSSKTPQKNTEFLFWPWFFFGI
jgi:hypothetical protein